jgi:hypothetical protein
MQLALLALCTSAAMAATPTAPAATQPTRFADREFTLKINGPFSLRSEDVMTMAVRAARELAPTVLDVPGSQAPAPPNSLFNGGVAVADWIGFQMITEEQQRQKFTMWVDLGKKPNAKPAAAQFMDQLMEQLEKSLNDDVARQRAEALDPLQRAVMEARQRVDAGEHDAGELRAKVRDLAGRADISSNTITGALTKLEDERQKLELDTLGKTARRDALEREIADQSARAEKKAQDDPIAAELQKAVDVRDEKVKFTTAQMEKGLVSVSEQRDAMAAAAEARAKLLERKREAMAEAGGGVLDAMNKELLALSIDLKELNARLDFVKKQLPGLRGAMDQLDALRRAEGELQSARHELDESTHKLRESKRRMDVAEPVKLDITTSINAAQAPVPADESAKPPEAH